MKNRFRQLERIQSANRAHLPAVAAEWLAPLRKEISALTRAAAKAGISDAELLRRIQALHDRAPRLLKKMDPTPLADALERASAPALIAGVLSGPQLPRQ